MSKFMIAPVDKTDPKSSDDDANDLLFHCALRDVYEFWYYIILSE